MAGKTAAGSALMRAKVHFRYTHLVPEALAAKITVVCWSVDSVCAEECV